MAEKLKIGSIKRFGARYGRKVKQKFGEVEALRRKKHKCPYCMQPKVKRLRAGIWECDKCKAKFTGKAYTLKKKKSLKEQDKEEPEEVKENKEEE